MRIAEDNDDAQLRKKTLIDSFYMLRTATILLHPIAPAGAEMICDYLNFDKCFCNGDKIFEPIYSFMDDPA